LEFKYQRNLYQASKMLNSKHAISDTVNTEESNKSP